MLDKEEMKLLMDDIYQYVKYATDVKSLRVVGLFCRILCYFIAIKDIVSGRAFGVVLLLVTIMQSMIMILLYILSESKDLKDELLGGWTDTLESLKRCTDDYFELYDQYSEIVDKYNELLSHHKDLIEYLNENLDQDTLNEVAKYYNSKYSGKFNSDKGGN